MMTTTGRIIEHGNGLSLTDKAKVGYGAIGDVYTAKMRNGTPVAVKRVKTPMVVDFTSCIGEIDCLTRLKNARTPNVVNLISIECRNPFDSPASPMLGGTKDDTVSLVMECANYGNLNTAIFNQGMLTYTQLKKVFMDISIALLYMHYGNMMHRDIKSENILLFKNGDSITAKFCDFGMSCPDYTWKVKEAGIGTTVTRAPEITTGYRYYDKKTDIWSLACVFYHAMFREYFVEATANESDVNLWYKTLMKIPGYYPPEKISSFLSPLGGRHRSHESNLFFQVPPRNGRIDMRNNTRINTAMIDDFNNSGYGGTFDQLINLMESMLSLSPHDRPTMTAVLQHPYFQKANMNINCVFGETQCVDLYPPPVHIFIPCCAERKWVSDIVHNMVPRSRGGESNSRVNETWYKPEIIFQAMDLFNRYINYLQLHHRRNDSRIVSSQIGDYMSLDDTNLYFSVCVYMSYKYFHVFDCSFSYDSFVGSKYSTVQYKLKAYEFEKLMLIEICKYVVYRPTIFELMPLYNIPQTDENIMKLLRYYCAIHTPTALELSQFARHVFDKLFGKRE